ncbi:MAG: DegT/DnrJ/EryC1/StrS aminotransferase family protein [Acidobacteriota bacterium]
MAVPFFRPELNDAEIGEVVETLRSGWLTTGPRTRRFEEAFADAVGARHGVALNSCTAGLHLATVALGLRRGQGVLVPTMTFAATAEVVLYAGAVPILVDCDPETLSLDPSSIPAALADLERGALPVPAETPVVGVMPVHVGGLMLDVDALAAEAAERGWWRVEDAAHAFPAAVRADAGDPWRRCGAGTADVTCFSFYANKTITTGEGGMAVCDDADLAAEIRSLSLHGLSNDAWKRYTSKGSWDYRIVAPGYKYNLTDIAAALGLRQLERAEAMRLERRAIAERFSVAFGRVDELELPPDSEDRIHSWHLYQLKLRLDRLEINRDAFLSELRDRGVGYSVHWRPLHLHPLYESLGWREEHCPNASAVWRRTVSLPIFPGMRDDEIRTVIDVVVDLCRRHRRPA